MSNLSEIRDMVRAEASIMGLKEYTAQIDFIINQELQRFTGKSKYEELYTETSFVSSLDATFSFNLPADFQLLGKVYFNPTSGSTFDAIPREIDQGIRNAWNSCQEGYPRWYYRSGQTLKVYPYTSFYNGDTLILGYYRRPVLLLDTDLFPVPSLEKPVQQATMARMLRLVNTNAAQLAKADAREAYLDSRSESAANN